MVDETGNNLGVLSLAKALEEAKKRNLDLILIAPQAEPPVAKIQSYDKFRYEKELEFKKQKKLQKALPLKQIQVSVKEARNDLLNKEKRIEEFLEKGHRVEIQLTLRGREKYLKDWAYQKLEEFLKMIPDIYRITSPIKPGGRGLLVQIEKTSAKSTDNQENK